MRSTSQPPWQARPRKRAYERPREQNHCRKATVEGLASLARVPQLPRRRKSRCSVSALLLRTDAQAAKCAAAPFPYRAPWPRHTILTATARSGWCSAGPGGCLGVQPLHDQYRRQTARCSRTRKALPEAPPSCRASCSRRRRTAPTCSPADGLILGRGQFQRRQVVRPRSGEQLTCPHRACRQSAQSQATWQPRPPLGLWCRAAHSSRKCCS
ncbi:hypothetical protein D9M72_384000 [compost metagenome]